MILVTGAAGKTGLAVLKVLHKSGHKTRALIHREEQKNSILGAGATEAVVGDLLDFGMLNQAIKGIDAIHLICPNVHPKEIEIGSKFIEVAKDAKVKRIVYHSVMYPQLEAMPHHWQKLRVEEALIQSGLDFTILQPASYMQNILPYWETILKNEEYVIPYSIDSVFTPIDLEDVAKVSALVLADSKHAGAIYQLAGHERLTSRQMAEQISLHLGKNVIAKTQSISDWKEASKKHGLDSYAVDTLLKMFTYYDRFGFAGSSQTLQHLLGHSPTTFARFLDRLS